MNWAKKMLWFLFGAVVTVLLMSVSTSRAVEPQQTLEQRVTALESRVSSLEAARKSNPDPRDPGEKHPE